ncbi:MAG: thioredoxin family protein [Candidatus Sumerlaeaceae bacterium]
MPRPPNLPTIDWRAVFASGVEFSVWLEQAEMPEHRERIQKLYDELSLDATLKALVANLARTVQVIAIAEDWCGDVVRFAPVMARIAADSKGKVQLRFISRDQHPDVFVRFLTNGGEAIPKFVFLNDAFVECGNWGPMPQECRRIISRGKGANDVAAARVRVKGMYESDPRCEAAFRELMELVETTVCERP